MASKPQKSSESKQQQQQQQQQKAVSTGASALIDGKTSSHRHHRHFFPPSSHGTRTNRFGRHNNRTFGFHGETSQDRRGSVPMDMAFPTVARIESRRGSLLPNIPDWSVKDESEQAVDLLETAKVDPMIMEQEEFIQKSVENLQANSLEGNRVLYDTFYSILEKLDDVQRNNNKLSQLNKLVSDLLDSFRTSSSRHEADFCAQVENLQEFSNQASKIESLEGRLDVQKTKVKDYQKRMNALRAKIERQSERETRWRDTATRRIRAFWVIVVSLLITWFAIYVYHLFSLGPMDNLVPQIR